MNEGRYTLTHKLTQTDIWDKFISFHKPIVGNVNIGISFFSTSNGDFKWSSQHKVKIQLAVQNSVKGRPTASAGWKWDIGY